MTIVSTANTPTTDIATSILNEFDGGSSTEIDMMIGIGLVKDSDAVFFQYTGEKQHRALLRPTTGKPITRLSDVRLSGISVAEDVGQYKQTKLNLFLETSAGRQVMVTSGLETIWTQCLLSSLSSGVDSEQASSINSIVNILTPFLIVVDVVYLEDLV